MANRFQDNYRPQHDGSSPFAQYPPRRTTPGLSLPSMDKGYGNGNPYMDEGGSSVPRKPKSPTKSPSGGMALPIPQKVK